MWNRLGSAGKVGLVSGVLVCLGLTAALMYWALHRDYQPLFSQLAAPDAAAIVEQLKKQKVPYELASDGSTIRVPADMVHETRLDLMSANLPLSGGVGFEIFDRQGLGTTEQLQRVSFQRALQGELSRTIGALDPVHLARVHLVMPETSIFRRDRQDPRAAVILTLKPGSSVSREQIAGIQRLVGASIAGLDPARVVVADQRGMTLSPAAIDDTVAGAPDSRLAVKQDVEQYLTRKIVALLDGAIGPGKAIVSIDATLNFDEIKRTTRDVTPAMTPNGAMVVRRYDSSTTPPADAANVVDSDSPVAAAVVSQSKIEYERGQRVEEVIAARGGMTRLTVGVVISEMLEAGQIDRIKALVKAAAGIDDRRGDTIVVQSMDFRNATAGSIDPGIDVDPGQNGIEPAAVSADHLPLPQAENTAWWLSAGSVVVILLAAAWFFSGLRRTTVLTAAQRAELIADIERALTGERSPEEAGGKP